MAKRSKYVVSVMLCLFFIGSAVFDAADVGAQESDKTEKLGNWWKRNPLSYDPMPTQFLYHVEGTYNWTRKTGNFTMDNHRANAQVVLRKNRVTSDLNYTLDKRDSAKADSYPDDENNVNLRGDVKHELQEDLRLALTKTLYGSAGIIWLRDELSMIQDRYTYYIGAGGMPIQTEKFVVSFFGALGHEELDYTDGYHEGADYAMNPAKYGDPFTSPKTAEEIDYEEGTRKSELVYLSQSFDWTITESVSFTEWFDIFQDISDSDKYRWSLDLSLNIALTDHVFFTPNYHEEYNHEPGLGNRPRDVAIGAGVKIVF